MKFNTTTLALMALCNDLGMVAALPVLPPPDLDTAAVAPMLPLESAAVELMLPPPNPDATNGLVVKKDARYTSMGESPPQVFKGQFGAASKRDLAVSGIELDSAKQDTDNSVFVTTSPVYRRNDGDVDNSAFVTTSPVYKRDDDKVDSSGFVTTSPVYRRNKYDVADKAAFVTTSPVYKRVDDESEAVDKSVFVTTSPVYRRVDDESEAVDKSVFVTTSPIYRRLDNSEVSVEVTDDELASSHKTGAILSGEA